jgi:GT2 family glycosyltransferase
MFKSGELPKVSIVILNFNGGKLLSRCLLSVLNLTTYKNYEILVVDNCSSDDSIEQAKPLFEKSSKVRLVVLGKNLGYAEGNNQGYSHVSSEVKYVVFLNNDVVVNEGWLEGLLEVLEVHDDIGAAQPVVISPEMNSEGTFGGYLDVFGRKIDRFTLGRRHGRSYGECLYAWGAAIITRKEIIDRFGLFNPQYFLTYEETDFCWRLRLAGFRIGIVFGSKVHHLGGATIKKLNTSPIVPFHITKNKHYTLLVNYQAKNLVKYAPWAFVSDVSDTLRDMALTLVNNNLQRQFYRARALGTLKGLFYVLIHFKEIQRRRNFVQRSVRRVSDTHIIGDFIIVPRPCLPEPLLSKIRKMF